MSSSSLNDALIGVGVARRVADLITYCTVDHFLCNKSVTCSDLLWASCHGLYGSVQMVFRITQTGDNVSFFVQTFVCSGCDDSHRYVGIESTVNRVESFRRGEQADRGDLIGATVDQECDGRGSPTNHPGRLSTDIRDRDANTVVFPRIREFSPRDTRRGDRVMSRWRGVLLHCGDCVFRGLVAGQGRRGG